MGGGQTNLVGGLNKNYNLSSHVQTSFTPPTLLSVLKKFNPALELIFYLPKSFMKIAFLWHLLKMFASKAWTKNATPPPSGSEKFNPSPWLKKYSTTPHLPNFPNPLPVLNSRSRTQYWNKTFHTGIWNR